VALSRDRPERAALASPVSGTALIRAAPLWSTKVVATPLISPAS
jgi:hypothetical protein